MSHTRAAVGQTITEQFAETDILTTLPLAAIGLPLCAHRYFVRNSRPHNSNTRSNNNSCMPSTTKHQNKNENRPNSCSCSAQTHKRKFLKPCRELHSLQVNDLIAILRTSASRQQLLLAQQQHAQQQQPLHAPHHKTSKKKTDQTAAAAAQKLTRQSCRRPAGNCTPCRSTIRLPPCKISA